MLSDEYIQEMSQLLLKEWRILKRPKPNRTDEQTLQRLKDGAARCLIAVRLQGATLPDELVIVLCDMLSDPALSDFQRGEEWNDMPELDRIDFRLSMVTLARAMGVQPSSTLKFFRAILCEVQHDPDPTGENPSSASVSKVAREAQVTNATVRRWRQLESYREMVRQRRATTDDGPQAVGN